jgi:hypothetical protein
MTDNPSASQLRRFGVTVGVGLSLLGLLSWYRGHAAVPSVLWFVGGILALLGLVVPSLLRPVQKVWMGLALILGWINTRIILGALFYLVFTPTGVLMRLFRDPLNRSMQPNGTTYWSRREVQPLDPQTYERQF